MTPAVAPYQRAPSLTHQPIEDLEVAVASFVRLNVANGDARDRHDAQLQAKRSGTRRMSASSSRADELLTAEHFYARTAQYMDDVDPTWHDERVQHGIDAERRRLAANVGRGEGSTALDCFCGPGTQAIALAELGWRVTGIDATEAVVDGARTRAFRMGIARPGTSATCANSTRTSVLTPSTWWSRAWHLTTS